MTFRTKLLLVSSLTIAGAIAIVTGAVAVGIRSTFDSIDNTRRAAVIERFRTELAAQGDDVAASVARAAAGDMVFRMALEANRAEPDFSAYVGEAQSIGEAYSLDFLDLAGDDGRLISSAHYPARFGYQHEWTVSAADRSGSASFLTLIPTQDKPALAIGAARRVAAAAGKGVLVLGARRLDARLLAALEGSPGLRVMLWRSDTDVIGSGGPISNTAALAGLIAEVRRSRRQNEAVVEWPGGRTASESILALPLERDGTLLAVLLVATSLRDQVLLERSILFTGFGVGAAGILLGVLLGWWTTARVTRPVAQLVAGARAVASGDLSARVEVASNDEIGELAAAFNHMTEQLLAQRERAVQAERVAAWRELARRLAHEMKNPLFPLQITVENLRKAYEVKAPDFDEILKESADTLIAELTNLKLITGRFSDFAKMPAPRFEPTDLNEIVQRVVRLHSGTIQPVLELAPGGVPLEADSEQLGRLLTNLILNARDAMPEGGELRISTALIDDSARLTVSDNGAGLTPEECERLFTPYYTTKQHGTGLGLAIVQSVVSDHGGRIGVRSAPGHGATFTIDLPVRRNL